MPYVGQADLDRPIPFDAGLVYQAYGGGACRLTPFQCSLQTSNTGLVDFQLDLIRALDERDSRAVLSFTIGADYATAEALARLREVQSGASLSPCELTDWWFRVLPSASLGAPVELTAPATIASNGLGTARVMAILPLETGVVLESLLATRAPLDGVAEARYEGISPRLPVVVRFDTARLLGELLKRADTAGVLPWQSIVGFFGGDPATLPLLIDGTLDNGSIPQFAAALTDRVVTRFGRYVPSQVVADAPVVHIVAPAQTSTIMWALSQPFIASRRVVLPVNLLGAAQEQAARLGLDSVVRRSTSASLPSLGETRVTALCNLPVSRTGVDALGVTLTFPPHLPYRPQSRTATVVFESKDTATIDVRLSPGEPACYRYSAFAVLTDSRGTRQIDAPEADGKGSPLHLSTDEFPIDFAIIEATTALGQLAVVSGRCIYEYEGDVHERPFTLDSGSLSTAIAIPRGRSSFAIDGVAVARDGSGQLRIGPIESPQARLDLTSFPAYGPQQAEVRCVFDDGATLRGVSLLPADREDLPENIVTLSFTPEESSRLFRWWVRSPFQPGLRYRPFDSHSGWIDAPVSGPLVLRSSQLRRLERYRPARETSESSSLAMPGTPVVPVGVLAAYEASERDIYDRIDDPSKKLYIPGYALAQQTVSGQERYRITMAQLNAAATLEVFLNVVPPASLLAEAPGAAEYPHRIVVLLDFRVAASSGARKSLEFVEVSRTDSVVQAKLTFASLAERDDVYRALTESDRDAQLIVQRHFDVRLNERPPSGGGGFGGGGGGGGRPPFGGGSVLMALPVRPLHFMKPVAVVPPKPDPSPVITLTPTFTAATTLTSATIKPSLSLVASAVALRTGIEAAPAREAKQLMFATTLNTDVTVRPIGHFVPRLPIPQLTLVGIGESDDGMIRCTLRVDNWDDFSEDFFAPSSDLPPCGHNKAASRTWVDINDADTGARLYGSCALSSASQLSELWFAVPAAPGVPARVHITMTDRRTKLVRQSNAVETSRPERSSPTTRDARMQLNAVISPAPFVFLPALHGYIFQNVSPTTGGNQLVRHQYPWKGTSFTYLQDASRPHVVYVFPDLFKMARRPDMPYTPFATVRVSSRPDATATDVVFDYIVAPHTDPKRLTDARARLLASPGFGAERIEFQPFLTSDVRFHIDRPTTAGAVQELRTGSAVVLQGVLKDTLTMPLDDFKLLFDAMLRRTASLFIGHVEIDIPGDRTETIRFSARMDDLAGEVFSYSATTGEDGVMQVTARNEIESPLSVQAIDATVTWNGQQVQAAVHGSAIPTASLPPGGTLQLSVTPGAQPPGDADPQVAFDLGAVTSIPERDAVWNSILNRATVEYFRFVTVKVVRGVFDPPAAGGSPIETILVNFEGGATAELTATRLEAKIRVDSPIDDVMLERPTTFKYRYTVTVIRASGAQESDPTPRDGASDLFFLNVVR